MEGYFHLCSDGALTVDLNCSEKDFVRSVNSIAVISLICEVKVLGYSVVDTHIHILMKCSEEKVMLFIESFQNRMLHFGCRDFVMRKIDIEDENYLKIVGIYVICQPTKDGQRIMPYDYKWSSASLYFRTIQNDLLWRLDNDGNRLETKKVSQLTVRQRAMLINTKQSIPGEWEVCMQNGIIIPSSFVAIDELESIYKTHNAFRVFMGTDKRRDEIINNKMADVRGISLNENESRLIARKICEEMFSTPDIRSLDTVKRVKLARSLREKYRIGFSQLSRRVYLPEDELKKTMR